MPDSSTEPPKASAPSWLNATVLGIGVASLCSDVGHEMASAGMPALLATVGASSAALGLIEGVADGVASFSKLLSGSYSDRLERRKPLAVFGYFLTAAGMASFAIATSWIHVLAGRVIGWFGRGIRGPVRNVLLTEATTPATVGRAFGLERAMDSAGAVLGPGLALLIIPTLGLHWLFALTLVPGLLAALAIAFLVREGPHAPQPHARLWTGMTGLPAEFRKFLVGVGCAGVGDFSNTLLILWATQAFRSDYGIEYAATLAVLLYLGYNVVYMISCFVSGMLADRFSKKWVLAIGYSLAVVPAALLLVPGDSVAKFALIFGFSGLYMGVWETTESSTAATLLPAEVRGIGFGTLAAVNGVGDVIASVAVGCLWSVSPAWAMTFVMVASLAGAIVIASTHPPPRLPS